MSDEQNIQPQDNIKSTDELSEDELENITGGEGGVNHSEFKIVKLLDASTPKITDGTSNTIMIAEQRP